MYAAYVPVSSKQVSMNEEGVVTGCEDKKVFEITGFRISGHAHDKQTGAAVKGVQVSLLSQDGHTLNTVETDEQGNYLFENVISGDYTLHADHPSCVLAEPTRQSVSVVLLPLSHSRSASAAWRWPRTSSSPASKSPVSWRTSPASTRWPTSVSFSTARMVVRLSPSSHPEPLACESTLAGCLVSLAPSGAFEFRDVPSGRYLLVGFPLRSHAASLAGCQLAGVGDRARGAARERGRRLGGAGTRLRRGGLHAARTRAG